jgi:hypothetical protein
MTKGLKTLAGIRNRRFAVGCGALLVLAFLQVSLASHQFEHVGDDAYKFCRVCVQNERLDDDILVSDSSPALLLHAAAAAPVDFAAQAHCDDVCTSYRSRAPPRS